MTSDSRGQASRTRVTRSATARRIRTGAVSICWASAWRNPFTVRRSASPSKVPILQSAMDTDSRIELSHTHSRHSSAWSTVRLRDAISTTRAERPRAASPVFSLCSSGSRYSVVLSAIRLDSCVDNAPGSRPPSGQPTQALSARSSVASCSYAALTLARWLGGRGAPPFLLLPCRSSNRAVQGLCLEWSIPAQGTRSLLRLPIGRVRQPSSKPRGRAASGWREGICQLRQILGIDLVVELHQRGAHPIEERQDLRPDIEADRGTQPALGEDTVESGSG